MEPRHADERTNAARFFRSPGARRARSVTATLRRQASILILLIMKARLGRWLAAGVVVAGFLLGGCATAPVTQKVHASAAARMPALKQVVIAPIDAELAELTAGSVLEPRGEWTSAAAQHLTAALAQQTGYTAPAAPALAGEDTRAELEEVQALLRAITLNRISTTVPGRGIPFPAADGPLSYHTDPLPREAQAWQADAVLFVFIRDSFASAGRKSLLALSLVGAAFTGVAVVPTMGSTAMSAALVDRDGTVLWFNHSLGGHDPRTPEGAQALVRDLLKGLPARPAQG